MQTDVYIKIINEKPNKKFWSAGFLVIPKVYAVIASPFNWPVQNVPPSPWLRQPCYVESKKWQDHTQKISACFFY